VENKAQFLADFTLPGFRIEPYVIEQPVHRIWRDGCWLATYAQVTRTP
jgi:hypothetical protein